MRRVNSTSKGSLCARRASQPAWQQHATQHQRSTRHSRKMQSVATARAKKNTWKHGEGRAQRGALLGTAAPTTAMERQRRGQGERRKGASRRMAGPAAARRRAGVCPCQQLQSGAQAGRPLCRGQTGLQGAPLRPLCPPPLSPAQVAPSPAPHSRYAAPHVCADFGHHVCAQVRGEGRHHVAGRDRVHEADERRGRRGVAQERQRLCAGAGEVRGRATERLAPHHAMPCATRLRPPRGVKAHACLVRGRARWCGTRPPSVRTPTFHLAVGHVSMVAASPAACVPRTTARVHATVPHMATHAFNRRILSPMMALWAALLRPAGCQLTVRESTAGCLMAWSATRATKSSSRQAVSVRLAVRVRRSSARHWPPISTHAVHLARALGGGWRMRIRPQARTQLGRCTTGRRPHRGRWGARACITPAITRPQPCYHLGE